MYSNGEREARIRKEAASQAIERTMQAIEQALGTKFPRIGTPTQNRAMMCQLLQRRRR